MDLAFLNSLTRNSNMPPVDPWTAGRTINYYYWGYLLAAAIGDGNVELDAVIFRGRTLGRRDRRQHRLGQHRPAADGPHPYAPPVDRRVARERLQLGLDRRQNPRDFCGWPAEIVG